MSLPATQEISGFAETAPAASRGRILVVDDDRLVLATLAYGLSQAGYDVIDADNGDDAILLAREQKPDLALLDIRMEGKSGFDVAAYLREYCQTPFMFLSAFSDENTVRQVKALGAVDYLVKPLDIRQIVPAVEAAFVQIDERRQAPALTGPEPTPVPPVTAVPTTAAATAASMPTELAMAVGVLMHRHSLSRTAALDRLQRMARGEGRTPIEQAVRLLEAVELLAS